MIRNLSIENFALIDHVNIEFSHGFTVITGETGSGKSILLNALNLILGERANFSVIGNRGEKAIVEAEIDISGFDLESFFEANDLDYFDQVLVRREITKQGRSRAFINDSPVQLTTLKDLTGKLIHIHSQYNTLELKDVNYQLEVLDVLAETRNLKSEFEIKFKNNNSLKNNLKVKQQLFETMSNQADYNNFQLNELQDLNLLNFDFDGLQSELSRLQNADEILSGYAYLKNELESDQGILDRLITLKSALAKKSGIDSSLQEFTNRIGSVIEELKDISDDAESKSNLIVHDPQRIEEITGLIDKYQHVLQKHRKSDQEELVLLMQELENSVNNLDALNEEIEQISEQLIKSELHLKQLAKDLHSQRFNSLSDIENQLIEQLVELKLPNTKLNFNLTETEDITSRGSSKIDMLFSPNAGVAPVPVHQAASGGELSRVMLALQYLMSAKTKLKTIFFDEIDTGVSGDVAHKMAETLRKMGSEMQVIAITHLPQVAAKGGQHLKVSKRIVDAISTTEVLNLNENERIEETARLMSGDVINEAAIQNAKALMS